MASSFPTAAPDSKVNFDSSTAIASSFQNEQGEDINAVAAKLGPGTSNNAPAANKLLRGTGIGTSEWDTDFKDEDTMVSDSATAVPSQQSTKAYVDTHVADTTTHGTTGTIVGTTDTQTLTNKTLTSPILQGTIDGWIAATDSWTYASADAPTFVITVPTGAASIYGVGDRIKLTQTTVKYFIVTAVTDTTLTVYGGTDYTLVNAAISLNYYSHQKAPLGFPVNPNKWTVSLTDTVDRSQASPVDGTWYNVGSLSISIPIGIWNILFSAWFRLDGGGYKQGKCSLSTATNSESDTEFSYLILSSTITSYFGHTMFQSKILALTSKTTYYPVVRSDSTGTGVHLDGNSTPTKVRAVCAYL